MSLLDGGKSSSNVAAGPNPWAGRVRAVSACAPWWPSTAIECVVEVQILTAGGGLVQTLVAHVGKSAKGHAFVAAPAAKRGDAWVRAWALDDPQLRSAVEAAALGAYHRMVADATPADPEPVRSHPELPF